MSYFTCYVESCKFNDADHECNCPYGPTIRDDVLKAAGFLPVCEDYLEKELSDNG